MFYRFFFSLFAFMPISLAIFLQTHHSLQSLNSISDFDCICALSLNDIYSLHTINCKFINLFYNVSRKTKYSNINFYFTL